MFNVDQIDGRPDHYCQHPEPALDPVKRIENDRFFRNTGGSQAYHSPVTDHIQMPTFEIFRDAASYVVTSSHEETHWTANPGRMGRDLGCYAKNKSERAREELIA